MFGILNVNKPRGITSREIVNRVQFAAKPNKVGHAGTLDPLADGVLVVCVGQATRLISYVQDQPKSYAASFRLGVTNLSCDLELELEPVAGAHEPTEQEIFNVLPAFVGQIEQVPPAYSAVKVEGKRAYDLARQGKSVEIRPRTVSIEAIELTRFEFPTLDLSIRCGSGTYIRSLGRDIARTVGTDAVMTGLTRTAVGPFELADAVDVPHRPSNLPVLLPAHLAVQHLPQLKVDSRQKEDLHNGLTIEGLTVAGHDVFDESAEFAATHGGQLVAIVKQLSKSRFRSLRNFK